MSSPVKTPSQPVADLKFTLGNMSDDILSGMELEQMRNLLITACDTIVPKSPISSSLVVPSNLLSTSMSLPSVTLSSSTIPKIDRVRSIALSGGIMTFTGPLVFFNSQTSFNANFGVDLTILRFTSRNKCQCATENTEYLASKFLYSEIFVVSIYLVILSNWNMLARIFDRQKMISDTSLTISKLKRVYSVRGKNITLTPDDLFGNFIVFLLLFSLNAMAWLFCLVIQDYNKSGDSFNLVISSWFSFDNIFSVFPGSNFALDVTFNSPVSTIWCLKCLKKLPLMF